MAVATEGTPLLTPRNRFEEPDDATSVFSDDTESGSDSDSSSSDNGTGNAEEDDDDSTPSWRETVRHLLPFILPVGKLHWLLAAVGLLGVVLSKLISLAAPLAFKWAIDIIADNATVAAEKAVAPVKALLIYFVLEVGASAVNMVVNYAIKIIRQDSERRFGTHIYNHLMNLDLEWHSGKHTGAVSSAMNRGKGTSSDFLSMLMFNLLPSLTEAVLVVGIFFKLGVPWAAVSTFVAVALYLLCLFFMSVKEVRIRRRLLRAMDGIWQKQIETLNQYETVATFGRNFSEARTYGAMLRSSVRRSLAFFGFHAASNLGLTFIQSGGETIGLLIAAHATVVQSGPRMSPGSFVIVQLYISKLFWKIASLGHLVERVVKLFTNAEATVKILRREPKVLDNSDALNWRWESAFSSDTAAVACGSREREKEVAILTGLPFYLCLWPAGLHLFSFASLPLELNLVEFENVTFQYPARDSENVLARKGKNSLNNGKKKNGKKNSGKKKAKKGKKENLPAVEVGSDDAEGGSSSSAVTCDGEVKKSEEAVEKEKTTAGIKQISFKVLPGTTTAFCGSSGSGKSTIQKLVLRLYEAQSGKITLDGVDIRHISLESVRRNIGTVSQETVLFNSTLRRNIIYGVPGANDAEVWSAARGAALGDFVSGLEHGLETKVGSRGVKLSGGERQRVGVARAIIKRPCVLLLDEATSALDSETERKVQKSITELCVGRTSLVVAHRLSTIMHADEICVMKDGEIVERGTHKNLLQRTDGAYRKMWQLQTECSEGSDTEK